MTLALIDTMTEALEGAERPLIISGTSLKSTAVLQAAANLAKALNTAGKTPSVSLISGEANSTGLTMLGGHSLEWALDAMQDGEARADAAVILENDLYQRLASSTVDQALNALDTLVVLDHQRTPTLERAHMALPAATFAEGDGTLSGAWDHADAQICPDDPDHLDREQGIPHLKGIACRVAPVGR